MSAVCRTIYPPQTGKVPSFRALNYRDSKTSVTTGCTNVSSHTAGGNPWDLKWLLFFFLCTAYLNCSALMTPPRRRLWWHFWQDACDLIRQEFGCCYIKQSARVCFSCLPTAHPKPVGTRDSSVTIYYILSHKEDCTRSTQNWFQISMLFLMVKV